MGINIGDKYIIEIGAVAELPDGRKKYFIKPFESLVFDRKGLEQLERFDKSTEKIYNTGYSVGYKDGAKNQDEVQYKKGYDAGRKDGFDYCRDNTELTDELKQEEYNKALEDASELMAYITQDFIDNCYPNNKGYNLYDLNAKYGLGRVLKDYKAYEEKKKVEEEIKVGDEVSNEDVTRTIIVTYIHNNDYFDGIDFNGVVYTNCYRELWNKTSRHFDEVEQLLDKLRGKDNDNN